MVAIALALVVDSLVLACLSAFLTGAAGQSDRTERAFWLSVQLEPPPVGTELAVVAGVTDTKVSLPGPARVVPEARPIQVDTVGTELAAGEEPQRGTELSVSRTLWASTSADPVGTELTSRGTELSAVGTELATREDLLVRLDEEIARNLDYPPRARSRGIQGRVLLDLRVDQGGRLEDCSVEASSGSPLLDGAAQRLIADIFPLPARLASPFSTLVAVEYRLR